MHCGFAEEHTQGRAGKESNYGLDMPSVSDKQHKLMTIAAHTKGGYGGVPQSVGKDFSEADKKKTKKSRGLYNK